MKKFLAILAVAAVITSCNSKKEEKKVDTKTDDTATVVTPPATDAVTPPATTGSETPKFADAEVQAYADAYAAYAETYKKAAESKDMSKFQELTKMGQDLGAKSAAMTQKLMNNPEEAKKLGDFIMAKSNEITEYAKKMTGQ